MKRLALLAVASLTTACGESPVVPADTAEVDVSLQYSIGALSDGCANANLPHFDTFSSSFLYSGASFFAGETLTLIVASPGSATSADLNVWQGGVLVASLSTPVPGTMSYTFPSDGLYETLTWTASGGATWSVSCEGTLPVSIDLKPGSDPSTVNPNSNGLVPVAILGSETFDVTDVDVTMLSFGPDVAAPAHDLSDPTTFQDHLEDVNGDGFTDLVSHYSQRETGLAPGDTEACITGATLGGVPIEGCDAVRVLGG